VFLASQFEADFKDEMSVSLRHHQLLVQCAGALAR
jgi:hypothetical protein